MHEILVGAHTSIAGGIHQALYRGSQIDATTIQIFTSNQKQWKGKPFTEEALHLWEKAKQETGIEKIMSHDSYLINLGSPKAEMLEKSRKAFEEELSRCLQLQLSFLNFHPGAATGSSEQECLDTIVASLLKLEPLLQNQSLRLLIETTAGQGTNVGYTFEHLGYLVQNTHQKIPIGVCIDTCHIFAAGYDIRTKEGWNQTLDDFEQKVGLKHLYALHVNDSMKPLGSRRDRHASLGFGEIGIESFETMMQHPKLKALPKYLETPKGDIMWKDEIATLKRFAKAVTV